MLIKQKSTRVVAPSLRTTAEGSWKESWSPLPTKVLWMTNSLKGPIISAKTSLMRRTRLEKRRWMGSIPASLFKAHLVLANQQQIRALFVKRFKTGWRWALQKHFGTASNMAWCIPQYHCCIYNLVKMLRGTRGKGKCTQFIYCRSSFALRQTRPWITWSALRATMTTFDWWKTTAFKIAIRAKCLVTIGKSTSIRKSPSWTNSKNSSHFLPPTLYVTSMHSGKWWMRNTII